MTGASMLLLGSGTAASAAPLPAPGSYDTTFNGSGVLLQAGSASASSVAVVPAGDTNAGNIVFTGINNGTPPSPPGVLYNYTPSGASQWGAKSLSNFVGLGVAVVPSSAPVQDRSDIVVVGWTNSTTACSSLTSPHHAPAIEMFTSAGAAAGPGLVAVDCAETGQFDSVTVDADGLPIAGGFAYGPNTGGTPEALVARFTTSLALDTTFGNPNGYIETNVGSNTNTYQINGVFVTGSGSTEDIFTTGGASFNGDPQGDLTDLTVAEFDHTGTPVSGFGGTGIVDEVGGIGSAVVVLTDGNVVAAGRIEGNTGPINALVEWTPTGALNTSFNSNGVVIGNPNLGSPSGWNGLSYSPTGDLITAVGFAGSNEQMVEAQFHADSGAVNTGFNGSGYVSRSFSNESGFLNAVATASNGETVAVGATPTVGNATNATVIDLNGPGLTITPVASVLKTTTNSSMNVTYNVALNEQLTTPWTVTVCAGANPSASVNVNSSGFACNAKTVSTTGATTTTISVLTAVVTGYGHGENVTATIQPVNGLGTTASSGTATTQIQHYRAVPYPGYYFVASDGGIFTYNVPFRGSAYGYSPSAPVVGMALAPSQAGYWVASANGGVFSFGVPFRGSAYGLTSGSPIVGIASDATGGGYWMVSRNGGLFTFGDAVFHGSAFPYHINNIVGIAATPDGGGYWLLGSDGGIFTFGDAGFYGSGYGTTSSPFVGIASYPGAGGYWLLNRNGGVYSFGSAPYYGGLYGVRLLQPPVGIFGTASGNGYWIVLADGGIANEGGAPFYGSIGGHYLNQPVVGIQ